MAQYKRVQGVKPFPTAVHPLGYSDKELSHYMATDTKKEFDKWMFGQTCAIDENMETRFYPWDVMRFIGHAWAKDFNLARKL